MSKGKLKKLLISSIIGVTSLGMASMTFASVSNSQKKQSVASSQQGATSRVGDEKNAANKIEFKYGDIVSTYNYGYVKPVEFREIVVAKSGIGSNPDLNNILFSILAEGSSLKITNTAGSNQELWNSFNYKGSMNDPIDFQSPWDPIQGNFFRAALYDNTPGTGIEGTNVVDWNKNSSDPSVISKTYSLTNKNTVSLQFAVKDSDTTNFDIFMKLPNNSWEKLTIKDGSGFTNTKSSKLVKGETIIQKDIADGIIKIYTPQNEFSNIPSDGKSWVVNKNNADNPIANKYFNVTIDEAFELLKSNKSDLKELVEFKPVLCTNSMSDFPIVLYLNDKADSKKRIEVKYGETIADETNPNKYFQHVFYYTNKGVTRHLYPWYFDTSKLEQEQINTIYSNSKIRFEKYSEGISVFENSVFANGTYIKNGELDIDKNRYPSQVPISEIKAALLKNIGNQPEGFSVDNIIIEPGGESKLIVNNKEGTISCHVLVNKYKDDVGNDRTDPNGKKIGSISISFRKKINPTTSLETFTISDRTLVASNLSKNEIRKIIFDGRNQIFKNLAKEVDSSIQIAEEDIVINSNNAFNSPEGKWDTGRIECGVTLRRGYLSEPYALPVETNNPTGYRFNIVLTGFKKVQTTIFHLQIDVKKMEGYKGEYANNFANQTAFKALYAQNKRLFVQNLPDEDEVPQIIRLEYNNVGDISVDGGQSGFVTAELQYSKIFGEKGNLLLNQTRTFTIYGFQQVVPTVINNRVELNRRNELATEVISGNQQNKNQKLKAIIEKDPIAFFGRSSLPSNYLESLSVHVNNVKNVVIPGDASSEWQIDATITMSVYFGSDGVLVNDEGRKYTENVKIDGFKKITPTTIPDDSVINVNSDYGSKHYAYEILEDPEGSPKYSKLKEIIVNGSHTILEKPIINGSLPPDYDISDNWDNLIVIVDEPIPGFPGAQKPQINNASGEVVFYLYLKTWYDDVAGEQKYTDTFSLDAPHGKVTLKGFINAVPTFVELQSTFEIPSNRPEYAKLKATNVSLIVQYLTNPNNLDSEQKAILDQFKFFLYNTVFKGFHPAFDPDKTIIVEPFDGGKVYDYKSLSGRLNSIKVKMLGYMDESGTIINDQYIVTLEAKNITGFKEIVPTTVNRKYEETKNAFQVSPEFADLTPNYIQENKKLAEVIYRHDTDPTIDPNEKIILGDIPPMFIWKEAVDDDYETGSLIITEVKVDEETSSISFKLSINCYYSASKGELVVNPQVLPVPVEVKITGFKIIPSTTINGTIIEDKFIYPTKTNTFRKALEIEIQPQSDARFKTAQSFADSLYPDSNNTEVITDAIIKNSIYYADNLTVNKNINQPIIIFNPEATNKLYVKALLIDSVNNDIGLIRFTAIVEGSYYSKSVKPTKIISNDNQASACIDINLKGFVPFAVYKSSSDRPVILIPILFISIIFVVFLISLFARLGLHKAKKLPKDRDLFFED